VVGTTVGHQSKPVMPILKVAGHAPLSRKPWII